jgi:hypothetical protein
MSHILRYIFVIAVAYDGRRLSPRPHIGHHRLSRFA